MTNASDVTKQWRTVNTHEIKQTNDEVTCMSTYPNRPWAENLLPSPENRSQNNRRSQAKHNDALQSPLTTIVDFIQPITIHFKTAYIENKILRWLILYI